MSTASLFKQIFSPYLGKYLFPKPAHGLFTEAGSWLTVEKPLPDGKIQRAIASAAVYGYFLSICARSFCIDIDDHAGKGEGYLLSIYERTVNRLGRYPSVVCKTPRGLHAFYFLDHHVPQVLLLMKVKHTLQGVPVEAHPTESSGLRIPVEAAMIDPRTFAPLNAGFEAIVNAAPVYHPVELFGAGILPDALIESLKERRRKAVTAKAWTSIATVTAAYGAYGIQAGATNAVLCEVIPVYRGAGLTAEEAAAEFAALLAPDYDGELRRNPRRLLQRVQSFYKNTPETRFNTLPARADGDLFTDLIAAAIAAMVTGPTKTRQQKAAMTQKRRTVKKAVRWLERWNLYIRSVVSRKDFLEMWNYLYPYFKKNTAEGLTPVSRNILQRIHHDYERWLLPFLKKIGYLERSSYRYSSVYGICYYYRINGYKFTLDTPQPTKPQPPKVRHAKALGISHFTVNKALQ